MQKHFIMKNFIFLIFLSLLTINGILSQGSSLEFTLTGVVLESETKEELEYAIVTVLSTDNIVVTDGLTNSKGKFSITVKKGEYNLMVEYISHKNFVRQGLIISNNLNLNKIELDFDIESLDKHYNRCKNTTVDIIFHLHTRMNRFVCKRRIS